MFPNKNVSHAFHLHDILAATRIFKLGFHRLAEVSTYGPFGPVFLYSHLRSRMSDDANFPGSDLGAGTIESLWAFLTLSLVRSF